MKGQRRRQWTSLRNIIHMHDANNILRFAFVALVGIFLILHCVLLQQYDVPTATATTTTKNLFLSSSNQWMDLHQATSSTPGAMGWNVVVLSNTEHRRSILNQCGRTAKHRYREYSQKNETADLALQVVKYCALYHQGGVSVDTSNYHVLVDSFHVLLQDFDTQNILVLQEGKRKTDDSLLAFNEPHSPIAYQMLQKVLLAPGSDIMDINAVLEQTIEGHVHRWKQSTFNRKWQVLRKRCDPFETESTRHCSSFQDCCIIYGMPLGTVLVTRSGKLLPATSNQEGQNTPTTTMDSPKTKVWAQESSSIPTTNATTNTTPGTIFEVLQGQNCLPSPKCQRCLSRYHRFGVFASCWFDCWCYYPSICRIPQPVLPVTTRILVQPPREDATSQRRRIPKIIHQTWFEEITPEKYPRWSRFVASFRNQPGWEYRFYLDDDARAFLVQHFPPQVVQAYDALVPGAFKADFFRYCVLLIHGGLYVDVDVLLEAPSLDDVIDDEVSFVVPTDCQGRQGEQPCLWNGFMASAPGHVFLVETLEHIVDSIRNRHTSLDYMSTFCPSPNLKAIFDTAHLMTTGPCILGPIVSRVLGKDMQTSFPTGYYWTGNESIAGKVLFLDQDHPMKARGFIFFHPNDPDNIIASTNLPQSSKVPSIASTTNTVVPPKDHYSTTNPRTRDFVYGLQGVYKDMDRAYETIEWTTVHKL